MKLDRRFAIVIGINDYSTKPLNFCVNDANAIAEILTTKCLFNTEDVYVITSEKTNPIKDITGHFENYLKQIEEKFEKGQDSFFFFFAGHGKHESHNSSIAFHDSFITIASIFEKINSLSPKFQFYVIDACESGGKILTRSNEKDLLKEYIDKSSGILFMYASTEKQYASEHRELGHGIFTNHFISAINDETIYQKGILTANGIQDYISRETQKSSNFEQTPVIENRSTGYYPFAILEDNQNQFRDLDNTSEQLDDSKDLLDNGKESIEENAQEFEYFPQIPPKKRSELFNNLKNELEEFDKSIKTSLESLDYNIELGENFNIFSDDISDKLTEEIVKKSIQEKVVSLPNIFSSEREEIKPNIFASQFSYITAFLKQEKEYRYFSTINWQSNNIIAFCCKLDTDNIYNVDSGMVQIIYQSIYGIGLADCTYYLDYNGYSNNTLKGPYINIYAFKYNNLTTEKIKERILKNVENYKEDILQWNKKRLNDISDFDEKSK